MPFDLNKFRAALVNGGARPTQFEMRITWPQILAGRVSDVTRDLSFLCNVSEIPASSIGPISVYYAGRVLNYAGDRKFGTLTVGVINDDDFKVRKALELWSAAIAGHDTTLSQFDGGLGSGSYATDGVVLQYTRNNKGNNQNATVGYKFIGMFPTNVAAIALNWSDTDKIEEFSVEFAYQWWEPIDASTGASLNWNF